MKIARIALFGAPNSAFDRVMLQGLADGFRLAGVQPLVVLRLLNPLKLVAFCLYYNVSAVFEINRSRPPCIPKSIIHIGWMQDPPSLTRCVASRSSITYYLTSPDVLGYNPKQNQGISGILYTGVAPERTTSIERKPLSDFSFVGYVPPPLTAETLARPIIASLDRPTFGDVVAAFAAHYRKNMANISVGDLHFMRLEQRIRRLLHDEFHIPFDAPFCYADTVTVFEHVWRTLDRTMLLDQILEVSPSLRIYGHQTRSFWDKYKPYYQCYLSDPEEICEVYRTTRLNLHSNATGVGMHARVLDCMGCGGAILAPESPYDYLPGGIQTEFAPHEHYIPYTLETIKDVARRWLADESGRKRIGEQARRLVLEKHTWRHRALQILSDIGKL